jgi:N-acetylneuraminate synthase
MKAPEIKIGRRTIGAAHAPFVIAEIGINHNGSLEIARKLIDAAEAAGADAVKFQKRTVEVVYSPEELARERESPFGRTNGDLKRALEFGKKEYDEIDRYCREKGILWSASPWDEASVDFLEQYDPPFYKIASASATDKDLISYIKSKGRPIIVSTGMMDDAMIDRVVKILGEDGLIILHCTATYPAKNSELHLRNIPRLMAKYPKALIGYSGHEVGAWSTLVAAALGASVLERHITLDRAMWGSDQAASLEVPGLEHLVKQINLLPEMFGESRKVILDSEAPIAKKLRRKNTI